MAKVQTRRSISVRGTTYERLRNYCQINNVSMSDFIEQRLEEFFGAASRRNRREVPPIARGVAPEPHRLASNIFSF